jgi:hypothetical protein
MNAIDYNELAEFLEWAAVYSTAWGIVSLVGNPYHCIIVQDFCVRLYLHAPAGS